MDIMTTADATPQSEITMRPKVTALCADYWAKDSTFPTENMMRPRVVAMSEDFWAKNPTFPKDLTYLGQVLTLSLIILNHIKFFNTDKLVVFMGTVYLPYLDGELKNNPLSPDDLWHQRGYRDPMKIDQELICKPMLDGHSASAFDTALEAHLRKNCKFLFSLCGNRVSPDCNHFNCGSRSWASTHLD
ncbi:hypothetical protein DID88_001205 [Monilinia fructigena]|uniref:Uncharacterized protein n=1 Tax=Monilinia fructigena TaxID=38457 RepID=A0A395IZ64_9HELO|nr:hypothetical protein DID88_001205 [Monilinia fructigena]